MRGIVGSREGGRGGRGVMVREGGDEWCSGEGRME